MAVIWGLTIESQILVWYFLHKIWPKQIKTFYCYFAVGNVIKFASVTATSVRRIFERGGGGRKFENNENQKKNFSTQNQSVFLPKIGWRPKKSSSFRFSPGFGPKYGEYQKKKKKNE